MINVLLFINLMIYDSLFDKVNLLHFLFDLEQHHLITVILMSQQILLALFIFSIIEYKHLIFKTLAFQFMLTEVWEVLQYLYVDEGFTSIAISLNIMLFVPWMFFAIYRSYDVKSDPIEKDMLYKVTHMPDSFTGFLLSILCENPTAGSGILCNDVLYIYRHGRFESIDYNKLTKKKRIILKTGIHKDNAILNYMSSMVGKDWRPWRNCITMQMKLWMLGHVRKF